MSIETAAILVGGTTSSTGGTSTDFIVKGPANNGDMRVFLDDGSEFIDSIQVAFSVKDPIVNSGAPNGYTQQRSAIKGLVPLSLDNGNRTVNSVKIELAYDPETTDTEKDALIELGCQLFRQAALDAFWKKQSLA
jgi:hypothetical protein